MVYVLGHRRRLALAGGLVLTLALALLGHGAWIFAKAELGQFLLTRAWAKARAGDPQHKPWPWADTWLIARLAVPSQRVSVLVLADASGHSLAWGPGLVAGDMARVAVIAGHRDTHFGFLRRLAQGDELLVETPAAPPRRYRVVDIAIVDARAAQLTLDPSDAPTLALVTCYPFDAVFSGTPWRYVVTARAVE
jgi:sortase A